MTPGAFDMSAGEPAPAQPPKSNEPVGRGLECRDCGCRRFRTVYTKRRRNGTIQRRRECENCGRPMTTVERPL